MGTWWELAWVEHVRATIPTPDDTTTLNLPTGATVLVTRRVSTDEHDRPATMGRRAGAAGQAAS
ncbi:MAG: UTRA domain-containing protein [Pseudonocardiaceae bacterium]|nr:UTRA domain-containing protein [Pseudonocardiaceae bacterium]